MTQAFGSALRTLRGELGLSQSALALRIGSTQRHLSFLETGRAQPSRNMIGRLATELGLNAAQRAALFDASGFRSPFGQNGHSAAEIAAALDTIEQRVLANWPFPAFVMDADWTLLRLNAFAQAMFAPYRAGDGAPLNALDIFLSDTFRAQVENWPEAMTTIYFRLQAASARSAELKRRFDEARAAGVFDGVASRLMTARSIPIFVPVTVRMVDGTRLNLTSLLGRLASVQDGLVEGFEIELMVPADAQTEACLRNNAPE